MLENGAIIKNTYFYIGPGIDFQQPHDTTIHNSNPRQATDFCECQTCIWYTYKQAILTHKIKNTPFLVCL